MVKMGQTFFIVEVCSEGNHPQLLDDLLHFEDFFVLTAGQIH